MSFYSISPHVHFCDFGDQVVFLDLKHDKYFAIGPEERNVLAGRIEGWPSAHEQPSRCASPEDSEPDILKSMLSMDLITTKRSKSQACADKLIEEPAGCLVPDDYCVTPTIEMSDVIRFGWAYARARVSMVTLSLRHQVERARRRKLRAAAAGKSASDPDRDREHVARYARLRPFAYTLKAACLLDSISLLEYLAIHGSHPAWVFGVRTNPFAAHTWVQSHGLVFNGSVELTRSFTPILVI